MIYPITLLLNQLIPFKTWHILERSYSACSPGEAEWTEVEGRMERIETDRSRLRTELAERDVQHSETEALGTPGRRISRGVGNGESSLL